MARKYLLLASSLLIFSGCASNIALPEIPEYHPASPMASEAPRIQAFDVLTVVLAPPPELPVPEGQQLSPTDPKMKGGMGGGEMKGEQPTMAAPEGTVEETAGEHVHHNEPRPGMREGMPKGSPSGPFPKDHPPAPDGEYQSRIDDDIQRGEAPMQHIKIPSEQRGMGADSTLYHEHKHHDSTHITHPNRFKDDVPIVGKQVWTCPVHPAVVVHTPGGRCPHCETVLVPVQAAE